MTSILNTSEIGTLDRQIAQLNEYKPIPENEVKNLCDKVSLTSYLPAEPAPAALRPRWEVQAGRITNTHDLSDRRIRWLTLCVAV